MRIVVTYLLIAIIAAAGITPAAAAILQPGTYQMQWQPGVLSWSRYGTTNVMLRLENMTAEEIKSCEGLKSSKCIKARGVQFTIILDESKGTGKGYDTAYMIPSVSNLDLKNATAIELARVNSLIVTDRSKLYEVNLHTGTESSSPVKKYAVNLSVYLAKPESEVSRVLVEMAGAWSGAIKTDEGEVPVILVDRNGNGVFGEPFEFPDRPIADMIEFKEQTSDSREDISTAKFFGKAVQYEDKLYSITASPSGETITVSPYTGDTGRIKVLAKDGTGESISAFTSMIYGTGGGFNVTPGQEIVVPDDSYKIGATLSITKDESQRSTFMLSMNSIETISVGKDEVVELTIGGPLSMSIKVEPDGIVAKQDEELRIDLEFTIPGAQVMSISGASAVEVEIKAPDGSIVDSGKAPFG